MSDRPWKAFERRVAKALGGTRRGPDYGGTQGGKSDVVLDGFAVECKLLSRPTWSDFLGAAKQAESAAVDPRELPIAIIKKKRAPDADMLVVIRLETLVRWAWTED